MTRFKPPDWNKPELREWIFALQKAIDSANEPIVLVAHSLSCLLVVHWAFHSSSKVAGAFLVAVPDPQRPSFPLAASSFLETPAKVLRFPSLIVASTNDPYGSIEYAARCAEHWNSRLVNIGAVGHINGSSNLGAWPEGKRLLKEFCEELGMNG
ncbi:hypothetical protein ACPOL_4122 [Acidisarcina polymorpha]|uniref:Esterase n=2 Tax=Acidisarcina polymorpha TaxID=2211140 RepID=A0A2Z5G2W7_9BACT|nr:hypothetical protein ACPOL_4122 [Acidisarcina polymorpha]